MGAIDLPRASGIVGRAARRRSGPRVNIPGGLGAVLWLLVVVVPIYWVVVTSLRTQQNFFTDGALVPPSNPTLENYAAVFEKGFARFFLNSIIVTVGAVGLTIAVGLMAAYAIVRSRRAIAKRSLGVFLLGLAIPAQSAIIPIFYMITRMRLYDTLLAVILPSTAFAIPVTVLIFTNYLRDIPSELFESMRLDGATEWQILSRLVLPLCVPALSTTAIYNGVNVWNNFLFPLVLTQSPQSRVLPLALWTFQGELTINVPAMMAAIVLSALPILSLYVLGRRQLIAGMTAGFGK
ncbi:carbohydrate ABC transporter permease [Actinomyces sp. Z3]|uniref:carbohydrate ABC transporter permease n=1 Tax=Actinomyces sp. Z3 TaxID=2250217 RepID=UPI000D59EBDC|nr:carbohydrate ABC transporter permease [Actinomyces sp. Z3]RAX24380.1 carbohydrate ABC transporter permease [Actinomyces sp. Z3]